MKGTRYYDWPYHILLYHFLGGIGHITLAMTVYIALQVATRGLLREAKHIWLLSLLGSTWSLLCGTCMQQIPYFPVGLLQYESHTYI